MQIQNFAYERPETVAAAAKLAAQGATLIAGGSDVMPQLKTEVIAPEILADLALIPALRFVEERPDGLHIGAMTTLSQLAADPLVQRLAPAVGQAARNVASPQIRHRGTIAGNVLQARRCMYYNQTKNWRAGMPVCYKVGGAVCLQIPKSPVCRALYYSDLAPALLAYGTRVCVQDASGERELAVSELITAHVEDKTSPLVITEFLLPADSLGVWSRFLKYSLRGSIDFPIVNFAAKRDRSGCKLFAGAIAPSVLELTKTEALLCNTPGWTVEQALEAALAEMNANALPVRETGLSIKVKKNAYRLIEELLTDLRVHWNLAE